MIKNQKEWRRRIHMVTIETDIFVHTADPNLLCLYGFAQMLSLHSFYYHAGKVNNNVKSLSQKIGVGYMNQQIILVVFHMDFLLQKLISLKSFLFRMHYQICPPFVFEDNSSIKIYMHMTPMEGRLFMVPRFCFKLIFSCRHDMKPKQVQYSGIGSAS